MLQLPIPASDLSSFVLRRAHQLHDKPALIDGITGEALTYGELFRAAHRLAAGLQERKCGAGRVLALMAPNCPEFAVVFHGTTLAGAAITTLNPSYTVSEVRHQLGDSCATVAVAAPDTLATMREAIEGTSVRTLVCIGGAAQGVPGLESLFGTGVATPVESPEATVAALPYSSGTTGLSKGVMLTHRNLVANIVQLDHVLQLQQDETLVAALPFFHIYGMNALMNPALAAGATVVTLPRYDLRRFLKLHAEHRARRCFVVPPIAIHLAKDPMVDEYDLSALRTIISGAAPLSKELSDACASRLCCTVTQGFGMTELGPVSHFAPSGLERPGSVGTPLPNTEVRVVSLETGGPLGPGKEGEVWIRGPQRMKGYHRNEPATSTTITPDGWLRTGDIGLVDEDGYLYVIDRLKELIKFKGFQIAPAELEATLLEHPDVADAAVVGRPDDEAGEVPVAFVVPKTGRVIEAAALSWFMSQKLASFKQVQQFRFVGTIPKSPSGKILRRVLREALTSSAGVDAHADA